MKYNFILKILILKSILLLSFVSYGQISFDDFIKISKNYNKNNPNDIFFTEYAFNIFEKEYLFAKSKNTINAYDNFIENYKDYYPEHNYIIECQDNSKFLKFEKNYLEAKAKNSIDALTNFISLYEKTDYEMHIHILEAKRILEEKELSIVKQENTIAAFDEFLKKYPNNQEASILQKQLQAEIEIKLIFISETDETVAEKNFNKEYNTFISKNNNIIVIEKEIEYSYSTQPSPKHNIKCTILYKTIND